MRRVRVEAIETWRRRCCILVVAVLAVVIGACGATSEGQDGGEAFWSVLQTHASEVEQYGSVAEMAASADLVVVGRISSIGLGRTWGSEDPADRLVALVLQVEIDEVLKGTPPAGADGIVSVEHAVTSLLPSQLREAVTERGLELDASTFAEIPEDRAVWFLRLRDDLGSELAPSEVGYAGGVPYRLVNSLGVIAEGPTGEATFPVAVVARLHEEALRRERRDLHDGEAKLPEERLVAEVAEMGFEEVVRVASSA